MSTPTSAPSKPERPQQFYINEHWDHCLDLTLRRVVYGGLAAGVAGLVLFRAGLLALVSSWCQAGVRSAAILPCCASQLALASKVCAVWENTCCEKRCRRMGATLLRSARMTSTLLSASMKS